MRQSDLRQVERAWRIRQLTRGVHVTNATEAERRAAAERAREMQQDQADREDETAG
jgi:hypothetical protein